MKQTLLTFSLMRDAMKGIVDADLLARIIEESGYAEADLMEFEFMLYGREKILKAFWKYGVQLGCLIAYPPFYTDPAGVRAHIRKSLELADEAGAKYLMVVPGSNDQAAAEACSRQEALDLAVQGFTACVEEAERYGIQVGFENTPQDYKPLAAPEDVQYVLDQVPGLGLIFDTGNFRVADPACDEVAIYEQFKDRIIRFHLKDVRVGDYPEGERCVDGQVIVPVPSGSGVIPLDTIIQKSLADGFDGAYAAEYAAPSDTSGAAHIDAIAQYRQMIDWMGEGRALCPQTDFPGLDKPVSRLFFGTATRAMFMGVGAEILLDLAVACGINAFDTARGYGPSENRLGDWMEKRRNREEVVILTKCGNCAPDGSVLVNRQVIEKELAESLAALKTDYIDIYLLHRDDPKTPVSEIIDTLNEAKQAGKIRVFGASNWTHERLQEANDYAASKGLCGFTCSSPNYGLARQVQDPWGGDCVTISGPENEEARAWYTENQMPVLAYSSLGRGFFSGRFRSFDEQGAQKVLDGPAQKGYLSDDNMKRLAAVEALAEKEGLTVPQVAMQFILGSPMHVFPIASMGRLDRIKENVEAVVRPMDASAWKALYSI